jgi:putative transcriptional regulator
MYSFEVVEKIRKLRLRMNLSQAAFADKFALPYETLREWEKNRKVPNLTAETYLELILLDPDAVSMLVSRMVVARDRRQRMAQKAA